MGITVQDPDGGTHTFADGTPDSVINSEMERRWAARGTPTPPAPTPLAGPGKMPPGASPGSISAKPGSLLEAEVTPLSAEAQRGLRMITGGGATNRKALEQAGRMILEKDPTYQARTAQVKAMGDAAGKRQTARLAGENILGSFAKLLHSFNETDDDTLYGAIGPKNTVPYNKYLPLVGGMTDPQAAAAYSWMPNFTGAKDVKKAWDLQNLFSHDVHGITNAMVASAGSGVRMSDARQEMFDSAMRDFMKSTNRKEATKILDHAKGIIANDFHLTPKEADMILQTNMKRIAKEEFQKVLLRAAKAPTEAVEELIKNAADETFVRSFNKHFNGGKKGLAEDLIKAAKLAEGVE